MTDSGTDVTATPDAVDAGMPEPGTPDTTRRFHPDDPDSWLDRFGLPVAFFVIAAAIYEWVSNGRPTDLDYFVPLANAFLHGQLGLPNAPSWLNELVPSGTGLGYVVYPPAPAIVLLPLVALFGPGFDQGLASTLMGAANVAIASVVIRWMGVRYRERVVLTAVFGFGTILWYSAQEGTSWHFAHVVATCFMLLAIHLAQRDGRAALIGLCFAMAAMSRLPVAMAAPFFLAYFLDRAWRERTGDDTIFGWLHADRPKALASLPSLRDTVIAAWPAVAVGIVVLALYMGYNQARFGSPTQNGYALLSGIMAEGQYSQGFFSLGYIPRMLYSMFLSVPMEVGDFPWIQSRRLGGLSILLTTPLFLWAFKARRPDWFGLGAWTAVILTLLPVLTHGDAGGSQFGFRYAQDVYPFLLLLTVRGLRGRISFEAWVAIAIGFAVNAWGMWSTYDNWWG